jgi:F-type H+-transporting ATPase subunit epsilon
VNTTFRFKLLTPIDRVLDTDASAVILPGSAGEFEVRPGHSKFVTTLAAGHCRVVVGERTEHYAVSGGFAEVFDGGLTVLADSAERADQIDVRKAEDERQDVLKKIAGLKLHDTPEALHLREHLARAEARLRVARLTGTQSGTKNSA